MHKILQKSIHIFELQQIPTEKQIKCNYKLSGIEQKMATLLDTRNEIHMIKSIYQQDEILSPLHSRHTVQIHYKHKKDTMIWYQMI